MPSTLNREDQQHLVERIEQERLQDLFDGVHRPHGVMNANSKLLHVWCPTCKSRGADRTTDVELRMDIKVHTDTALAGRATW